MWDAIAVLLGLRAVGWTARDQRTPVVPEPEFTPFRLPNRGGAAGSPPRAAAVAPANTASEPRTLQELGVPGPLAADLEAALRGMGRIDGERIVGFTYRTPDGASHALRAGTAAGKGRSHRAA